MADVTVRLVRTGGTDDRAAAHAALRDLVAAHLSVSPADVRITKDAAGRPVVEHPDPAPHVSLSHTVGAAAVAVSWAAPVGVDVEPSHEVRAVELSRRYYTPSEAAWVADLAQDDRSTGFLRLWTCKEAVGKARGRGLSGGGLRQSVPIGLSAAQGPVDLIPVAPDAYAIALAAPDGFLVAVACLRPARAVLIA